MNKTIQSLGENRTWTGQYGEMVTIPVMFEDGTKAGLNCKLKSVEDRRKRLTDLIGKPGEFELEDAGKFDDGNPKPMRLKAYPGMPVQNVPGGSGGSRGSFNDPLRYAVEAAVSLAQTAWRLPEGATEHRTPDMAQGAADRMLSFVEHAIPRILKASQGEGTGTVSTPTASTVAAAESGPSPQPRTASQKQEPGTATTSETPPSDAPVPGPATGCRDGNHLGPFTPAPNEKAAERGIVVCGYCKQAGMWETQGALA